MKKLLFAAPALLFVAGCAQLNSASTYVQGLIKAAPESVSDAIRVALNLLMSIFSGVVTNFFNHLIPPVQ